MVQEPEEVACEPEPDEPRREDAPYFDLDDPIHPITHGTLIGDTISWLRYRGYRVVITELRGEQDWGIAFCRKNKPATLAVVGDVLEYDGKNVVVME